MDEEVLWIGVGGHVLQEGDGLAHKGVAIDARLPLDTQHMGVAFPLVAAERNAEELLVVDVKKVVDVAPCGWLHVEGGVLLQVGLHHDDVVVEVVELHEHFLLVDRLLNGIEIALLVAADKATDDAGAGMLTEYLEVEDLVLADDDFRLDVVALQKGTLVELGPHEGQGQLVVGFGSIAVEGDHAIRLDIGGVDGDAVGAHIVVGEAEHVGLVLAEVVEQVAVGSVDEVVVAVEIGHIFATCHGGASVARTAQSLVFLSDDRDEVGIILLIAGQNARRPVGRAVVHADDLIFGRVKSLTHQRVETTWEESLHVIDRDYDG